MTRYPYDYDKFVRDIAARDGARCRVAEILRARVKGPERHHIHVAAQLDCDGQLDGHHLIPKQRINSRIDTMLHEVGPDGAALVMTSRGSRLLVPQLRGFEELYDPDNPLKRIPLVEPGYFLADRRDGILACRRHHDLVEWKTIRLCRDDLPDGIEDFAAELHLEWILEREFPEGRVATV